MLGADATGGFVMFEIGDTQGAAVSALLRDAGFVHIGVARDLSGRDRVVWVIGERHG
jgi:release factor glutamine methyltransferase